MNNIIHTEEIEVNLVDYNKSTVGFEFKHPIVLKLFNGLDIKCISTINFKNEKYYNNIVYCNNFIIITTLWSYWTANPDGGNYSLNVYNNELMQLGKVLIENEYYINE